MQTKLKKSNKKKDNKRKKSTADDDSSDLSSGDEVIAKEDIDYNAPKPGPHAKVIYFLNYFLVEN